MLEKEVNGTKYHIGIKKKLNLKDKKKSSQVVSIHDGKSYGINILCPRVNKAIQLIDLFNLNPDLIDYIYKKYTPSKSDIYLNSSEISLNQITRPIREIKRDERYSEKFNPHKTPLEQLFIQ